MKLANPLLDALVLSFLLILLIILRWQMTPVLTDVRYALGDNEGQASEEVGGLPVGFDRRDDLLTVSFMLHRSRWMHPLLYTVHADDCVKSITINGQLVSEEVIGSCEVDTARDMRLGSFLAPGSNEIVMRIPDTGGWQGLRVVKVSNADTLFLVVRLVTALVFSLLWLILTVHLLKPGEKRWISLLFLVGVLLRLLYFEVTPFTVRSYDADGHLEYIRYMSEHRSIPLIREGWQYYQPPLYYALTAPVYALSEYLQPQPMFSMRAVQLFSLALSLLTLGVCVWISRMIFLKKEERVERLLFVAFFAVFSGVIMQSVRINNDILAQCLSFTAIALCLHFWQSGSVRSWYCLIFVLAAGILAKANVLLLLPVAFLALLFQRSHTVRERVVLGGIGLCIVLSLTEWLYVLRMFQDFNTDLVGNAGNLNGGLSIPNTLSAYTTFNPLQILRHPYNDAFGDEARRMYFLEYLYRSAFFGEFDLSRSLYRFSQWMLLLGFGVSAIALTGFLTGLWRFRHEVMPLWLAFFALLAGHAFFRFLYPFSSSQDFRYSILLLVPVAYFALLQVRRCKHARLRTALLCFFWIFIVLAAMYTVMLSVINPH